MSNNIVVQYNNGPNASFKNIRPWRFSDKGHQTDTRTTPPPPPPPPPDGNIPVVVFYDYIVGEKSERTREYNTKYHYIDYSYGYSCKN